jgi:hypothetical protein
LYIAAINIFELFNIKERDAGSMKRIAIVKFLKIGFYSFESV